MRYIYITRLSGLLAVSTKTLEALHKDGVLRFRSGGQYRFDQVNAFLAAHAEHFEQPPTLEALIVRKLELIRISEAAKILGITDNAIRRWLKKNPIPIIRIRAKSYRVSKAVILANVFTPKERVFNLVEVGRILGINPPAVAVLVRRNILLSETPPRKRLVALSELISLLQKRLYTKMRPIEWIEGILQGTIILVPAKDAKAQLGVSDQDFNALIANKKLDFIQSRGGKRLFTQASIDANKA